LCHDQILARHRSPLHIRRACTSPAIDTMTINQRRRPALHDVSCPATNASTSDFHTIHLTEQMNQETRNPGNSVTEFRLSRLHPDDSKTRIGVLFASLMAPPGAVTADG